MPTSMISQATSERAQNNPCWRRPDGKQEPLDMAMEWRCELHTQRVAQLLKGRCLPSPLYAEMDRRYGISYWIDRARSAPNLLPGWPVMGLEEKDFKILPKLSPEQEAEALRLATEGFQERIRNLTVA